MTHLIIFCAVLFFQDGIPSRFEQPQRLIAIGDVHGDLDATKRALRLAGAIDSEDRWIGGELVVVQTGDQLDRGDDEQAIMDLFELLIIQAKEAGGAFHVLNGNHELMNARLDLRYVTPGGFKDFEDALEVDLNATELESYEPQKRARVAAFRPGGVYAQKLARRNTVVVVGDTVFAHGGVLPKHVDYGLERMNSEIRAWLRGELDSYEPVHQRDSPTWVRDFSRDTDRDDCRRLDEMLTKLNVKRLVVGHTVQKEGITSACDQKVWRIDVGMSRHYGGTVQVLEINPTGVRILKEGESP